METTFRNFAFIIILFWALNSCNSLDPNDKLIPGTYSVSGIQVVVLSGWPWTFEEILSRDTSDVEFTFEIVRIKGKQDSVYFKGLEGANAGNRGMLPAGCSYPADCAAYARLSRNELEFDLVSPGGRYFGIGQVQPGAIKLDTHFLYRNIRIDYDLYGFYKKE